MTSSSAAFVYGYGWMATINRVQLGFEVHLKLFRCGCGAISKRPRSCVPFYIECQLRSCFFPWPPNPTHQSGASVTSVSGAVSSGLETFNVPLEGSANTDVLSDARTALQSALNVPLMESRNPSRNSEPLPQSGETLIKCRCADLFDNTRALTAHPELLEENCLRARGRKVRVVFPFPVRTPSSRPAHSDTNYVCTGGYLTADRCDSIDCLSMDPIV
ncbi:hypothetical protein SODALDRAFT_113104 [Sodiomyces alkalinus F11]|uniref:Uncharacterized protein n=1 Tax=Sodiomyces alkalinus (strain CBS 110278 / VKM F-3762 / F11) TaxID=1314773 RepID=A0A3N2Q333_SODAK|nr:hypothetical protein SODALDRAFT_113104 [Sodiomyces alkalinus F11]ROT41152.1 hypothetical protein SODALDRAFT_113104 [Sodiomyces alkalinus F11]